MHSWRMLTVQRSADAHDKHAGGKLTGLCHVRVCDVVARVLCAPKEGRQLAHRCTEVARPRRLERAAGRPGALGGRRGRDALAAPQHLRPWPRSMLQKGHTRQRHALKAGKRAVAGAAHLGRGRAHDGGGLQLQRRPARRFGVGRLRLRGSAWLSASGGGKQRPGSVGSRAGEAAHRAARRLRLLVADRCQRSAGAGGCGPLHGTVRTARSSGVHTAWRAVATLQRR